MKYQIGLDARMMRHTGIGTYIRGLVSGWQDLQAVSEMNLALFGAQGSERNLLGAAHFPFSAGIYTLQEQWDYLSKLRHCHLWHSPHYNVPYIKGQTKLVVTVHDLIHWIFRKDFFNPLQAFYAKTMLTRAVTLADHIITVSQHTRKDLTEHFNADPEKISVIYEGVSSSFRELNNPEKIENVRKKYGLPKKYFLFVGSLKPHKNILWLLKVFSRIKAQKKIESALAVVGKKDKRYPKGFEALQDFKSKEDIFHLSFVEDEDLVALYNGAIALIHPSLYEGFGLTVLEAMACGTPVIACAAASVPEVAGDAAFLIEPCSDREMEEAIVRLEKFPGLREDLHRKGKQQVSRFCWKEAAAKTLEVYEKVLAK